jgi:hypothetical protein
VKPPAAPPPAPPPDDGAIVSARPKDSIPAPRLPRVHEARDATDLARVCQLVESEVASLSGVSGPFASGITSQLRRALDGRWPVQVFPVGMYYFIVSEAGRGRDKRTAAQNLAEVHRTEALRKLSDRLPARERKL